MAFAEEITPVHIPGKQTVTVIEVSTLARTSPRKICRCCAPHSRRNAASPRGNSSGINDWSAAMVLMKEGTVRERGLGRLATLEYVATAGIEPGLMGYSPALALRELFHETGLTSADIGTVELDEAFAAQAVPVFKDAKLDQERIIPTAGRWHSEARWAPRGPF
jgi:acetyl-CoA C-acetyltransferase